VGTVPVFTAEFLTPQKIGAVQKHGNSYFVAQTSEIFRKEKEVQSTGDVWWRQTGMASHVYASYLSAVSYCSSEFGDNRSVPSVSNLE
jgi:hypothetical protein